MLDGIRTERKVQMAAKITTKDVWSNRVVASERLSVSKYNKVLIVTPFCYPNVGGAETFTEDLAKVLGNKSTVHICTIKWDKPILWEGKNLKGGFRFLCKLLPALRKMTRKYKYQKVYALGFIASVACILARVKFSAIMLCLYDFKKPSLFVKAILNKAKEVFVEGNRCKQDMLTAGVDKSRIIKFQHWCDQSVFQYVERNNKKLKVLFIGRAIKRKGKHIIEGCESLTKDIKYTYVENVPYKELVTYYKAADVVVVPSLYTESFSRVVAEAASCGCVVIASNYGSLPEMVTPFGICIPPTAYNFSLELIKLSKDRALLERKQTKTAWYAKEHFSEKNADCFLLR